MRTRTGGKASRFPNGLRTSNLSYIALIMCVTIMSTARFGVYAQSERSILKPPFDVTSYYYPSGFMGDGELGTRHLQLNDHWRDNCHSAPTCVQITYRPGPVGWAGGYWQYPDSNWGDRSGRAVEGANKVVFWARGQKGGELVDFKAGGINASKKHRDSFEKVLRTVELTTQWQAFEIDLRDADTTSVIGAFAWFTTSSANPGGL